jgi:TolB-like protein/tetratricopeptide (TPR) repeat protein
MSLIAELKRRKVFKVGAAYLVVAWLAVQAVSIGFPAFDAPPWVLRVFILVAMLGFPVALVFAWAFDRTPDGVKAEVRTRASVGVYLGAAALVALALGWYFKGQPSYRAGDIPASSGPSVAVLPFANMSGKPDEDYFSDGMTEELLNVLAKIPKLNVAARTSVFEFKGKGGDVREIGRKLGVSHIVEGSVRRDGGQVRITAQLIRVVDGFHVWSDSYDRELKSVFAVQDDIARHIGEQLQSRLGVGELPAARIAIDPAAYDEYLKGRALYRERTNLPEAVAHLQRAVELSPQFGAAWASLALAHEVVYWFTTDAERAQVGDSYALMIAATERATALDPNAAMTLHARANVARAQVRYADAERIYLEAIKADASYTDVREDYAELLGSSGYPEEAEKATRELLALDPRVTNFWWRLEALGLHTGRAELVDEASAKIREIDPGGRRAHIGRVLLALELGQVEAARTELAAAQRTAAAAVAKDALLFHWAVKDPDADDAEARRLIGEQTQFAIYAVVRSDRDLFLASFESDTARIGRYGFFPEVSYPVAQPWLRDPRVKQALVRYGFVGYWREKGWPALCRPLGSDDFECGPPAAKN